MNLTLRQLAAHVVAASTATEYSEAIQAFDKAVEASFKEVAARSEGMD